MANSAFTPSGITTSAATQTQQEAASATEVFVSPGMQKFHPGHPKAWVSFNGSGVVAKYADYNVTSITDNAAGDFTANFGTAFSSINYAVTGSASNVVGVGSSICVNINSNGTTGNTTPTASACRFTVTAAGVGNVDPVWVTVAFFGDQ